MNSPFFIMISKAKNPMPMPMPMVKMIKMMMMTTKQLVLVLVFMGAVVSGYSQKDDFGIWYGISTEHKLFNKFELCLSTCVRTFDNASKIEEAFLEAGVTYKFNKYLAAGGSYRITENIEKNNSYYLRHKWFLDLKGSLPAGDFSLTTRIRFQERYKTYFKDEEDKIPDSHLRWRLKVLYDIPSFPVNPFISAEAFIPVFSETSKKIDKNRFMFGAEYNIAKKHSLEVEYIFQRDYLPHLSDINILSVNYNIKF